MALSARTPGKKTSLEETHNSLAWEEGHSKWRDPTVHYTHTYCTCIQHDTRLHTDVLDTDIGTTELIAFRVD